MTKFKVLASDKLSNMGIKVIEDAGFDIDQKRAGKRSTR